MRPVFFLRHFNDIDQIAPVMWRCLERDDDVHAFLLNRDYPGGTDPRLNYLSEYDNFQMENVDSFLDLTRAKQLFSLGQPTGREPEHALFKYLRKGLQQTGLAKRRVIPALNELDPSACVFEWGPPTRTSHREFFEAATALDIPTLCFPHGLNIYLNKDFNPNRKEALEQGRKGMRSRNRYDAYVTQSEYDKEQEAQLGVDPETHYVLGSARYYPEWQSINQDLYEEYDTIGQSAEKTTVVFMLPHWGFNIDKEQTLQLISALADQDWIQLVVKEHTRGDSLPSALDDQLVEQANTDVVADVSSVSLIKWSDIAINFGSSIGIEVLLQNKQLVTPSYLHSNTTIFTETGACHQPVSNNEAIEMIEAIHNGETETIPEQQKHELYRAVVYGGKDPHDVLAAYRNLIKQFSSA